MAKYLDTREIFSPVIATEDPTFFWNDKVPIKKILHLETPRGIELLQAYKGARNALDICFIEIEDEVFK